MNRIIKIILSLSIAFLFVACGIKNKGKDNDLESNIKLDMSSATAKQKVLVDKYIDGDTTSFKLSEKVDGKDCIYVNYIGVDAPEATNKIEPYGKKASEFVKSKLKDAISIVIESDGDKWTSNNNRYNAWVWYRNNNDKDYRNLNIELIKNGFSKNSEIESNLYIDTCNEAVNYAKNNKLNYYSEEEDPNYCYDNVVETSIRELRLNGIEYQNKKVAFDGVVFQRESQKVFIQEYDDLTGMTYGIPIVYNDINFNEAFLEMFEVGNRVKVVGNFSYQKSDSQFVASSTSFVITYESDFYEMKVLSSKNEIGSSEFTTTELNENVRIEYPIVDEKGNESDFSDVFSHAFLAQYTYAKMTNLSVVGVTTEAVTLGQKTVYAICSSDYASGIVVYTSKLNESDFNNKIIGVSGTIVINDIVCCLELFTLDDAKENQDTNSAVDFKVDENEISFDEEVVIKFYTTMNAVYTKVLENALEEFKTLYPNITVKHMSIGGYNELFDQITVEIYGNAQPNLSYCYPDHVAYYNSVSSVIRLDNLILSAASVKRADGSFETLGLTQEQIGDYIQAFYKEGRVYEDGHMYTLPFSKSTEVLYYNKTAFEANGWKVPTTWAEMKELCIKIKEKDPNCIPLGYDSDSNWFITLCEQYGYPYTSVTAPHFLFNTPEARGFVKELRSWYQTGLLTTQGLGGGYVSSMFVETDPNRIHSYMVIASSASATKHRPELNGEGTYPFEVGIATIPQVDPSNPKVIFQGPNLCIFNKENKKEVIASWLLAKYLTTSVTFQANLSLVSGYMPVIKSVVNNNVYKTKLENANGYDNISSLAAKICLAQETAYFTTPAFSGSSEARKQVGIIMKLSLGRFWDESQTDSEIEKIFIDCISECEYFG